MVLGLTFGPMHDDTCCNGLSFAVTQDCTSRTMRYKYGASVPDTGGLTGVKKDSATNRALAFN